MPWPFLDVRSLERLWSLKTSREHQTRSFAQHSYRNRCSTSTTRPWRTYSIRCCHSTVSPRTSRPRTYEGPRCFSHPSINGTFSSEWLWTAIDGVVQRVFLLGRFVEKSVGFQFGLNDLATGIEQKQKAGVEKQRNRAEDRQACRADEHDLRTPERIAVDRIGGDRVRIEADEDPLESNDWRKTHLTLIVPRSPDSFPRESTSCQREDQEF